MDSTERAALQRVDTGVRRYDSGGLKHVTIRAINLKTNNVQTFASRATVNAATGVAVGLDFSSPDNLAVDADGNIYIVEDQIGGLNDIWFATDANRDGVAESLSRWATLPSASGEPTGLFFDPTNPNIAYVNVMFQDGNDRLIRISAVPEPASYALRLAGLGLLGVGARRRRWAGGTTS